jgi:hypothetical protein
MMVAASRPLRQPGILVYLCGLTTSILALGVVELLNKNGTNVMGWYANGIIPAGALLVGIGSGLGYAVASRGLQVKLGRAFIVGMVVTAFVDYWAAQYVTYLNLLEQHHVAAEQYPFTQYVRDMCEKMSFVSSSSKKPGSDLGIFGYFFKLLEMAGYVLGATLPSLFVSTMPYCKACQQYLRQHRTGFFSSPTMWRDVKRLAKKERGPALQSAIDPLLDRAGQLCQEMAATSLKDTEAVLAGLDAKAVSDTAAHIKITLLKCPTCEAHVVRVNLVNYSADKQVANNTISTLEKNEPAASGTSS